MLINLMNKHLLGKIKRQLTRYKTLVRSVFLMLFLGIFIFSIYATLPPTIGFIKKLARGPAAAFSLARDHSGVLRSSNGRTNILLLGMGGANHEGAELTDSI